jgi:hypothetical protein
MNRKLYQLIISAFLILSLYFLIIQRNVALFITIVVSYVMFELVLYMFGVKRKMNEKNK